MELREVLRDQEEFESVGEFKPAEQEVLENEKGPVIDPEERKDGRVLMNG